MSLFLFIILSAALVFNCSCSPLKVPGYSVMGDNLRGILEELRLRMHMNMTEELGIPALDPFEVDSLLLNMNDFGLGDANFTLTDVRGVGGNEFIVNDVDFNIIGLSFLVDLTVPKLQMSGNFVGVGQMFIMSIEGRGPFTMNMSDVHMRCEGQLQFGIFSGWAIRNMNIDFSIKGMETNFQGLENNEDLFNEVMSAVGPEIMDENWPVIEPLVVAQVEEMMLAFLNDMTLAELFGVLMGNPADIFPPIQPIPEIPAEAI